MVSVEPSLFWVGGVQSNVTLEATVALDELLELLLEPPTGLATLVLPVEPVPAVEELEVPELGLATLVLPELLEVVLLEPPLDAVALLGGVAALVVVVGAVSAIVVGVDEVVDAVSEPELLTDSPPQPTNAIATLLANDKPTNRRAGLAASVATSICFKMIPR